MLPKLKENGTVASLAMDPQKEAIIPASNIGSAGDVKGDYGFAILPRGNGYGSGIVFMAVMERSAKANFVARATNAISATGLSSISKVQEKMCSGTMKVVDESASPTDPCEYKKSEEKDLRYVAVY